MAESATFDPAAIANDGQRDAANPLSSVVVTANAGSGKTKVLIDRVARLLLGRPGGAPGADPASILCITYTRAAANEMMSRLFRTLGEWAVMDDVPLRATLSALEHRSAETYTQDELRAARSLFARALETPGGLRIETIHAFCARVLRRFPLEAGIYAGFRELEPSEADRLWEESCTQAIFTATEQTPEDLERVSRISGGQGARDTLASVRSSASVIDNFARAHSYCLEKIGETLREHFQPPPRSADQLLADAFGHEMPREKLSRLYTELCRSKSATKTLTGLLAETLEATDAETAWQIYRKLIIKSDGSPREQQLYSKTLAAELPEVALLFSLADPPGSEVVRLRRLEGELERASAFERTLSLLKVGIPALRDYQAQRERFGFLDFDDLIQKTLNLLKSEGQSSWVLYKLDGGISHLLLDEAQDTSPSQWQLIQALTSEFRAGQGREHEQDPRTVFVVGDEKQSIYSFQGADPDAFRQVMRELTGQRPPARQVDLLVSFRSSPEILTFVDAVWNSSPTIEAAESAEPPRTADQTRHIAKRHGEPGLVELWPVAEKPVQEDADAWQRPVDSQAEASPKARLANKIATDISQMIGRGDTIWDGRGQRRAVRPEDILILVRQRQGGLFEALLHCLKRSGLPVAGADRLILTDHIAVQDCLNLMRFALLPHRDLTLAEILRGPFLGLVDDDAYLYPLAAGRSRGETLWSRVQCSQDPEVVRAAAFLEMLISRRDLPPYEFLMSVLTVPDARGQTGWQHLNARLGEPARDPVDALLSRALAHDSAGPSSLQLFLNVIESEPFEIKRDLDESSSAIRIMTVHGAKGLQAPIVILPDTTGKPKMTTSAILESSGSIIWSPRKSLDTPSAKQARLLAETRILEEHRRLLYVALTRAQDRLIIAGAWYGRVDGNNPGYNAQSWYADCLAGMKGLNVEPVDGVWRLGLPPPAETDHLPGSTAPDMLPEWFRQPYEDPEQGPTIVAPSRLTSARPMMLAPFEAGRETRLRRGRLIHALLQHLPDIPDDRREESGRSYLSLQADLGDSEISEMLASALGVLRQPEFAHLFARGGRAEAEIIGTAPDLPKGIVVQGRVDRLVVQTDRVLILDYKTDQPAPASINDVAPSYIAQMAAYWAVLRQLYPDRRTEAALCWTDGPILMPIPEALLTGALAQIRPPV